MPISLDRLGVRTHYASRRGVPLNSNVETGGGTDAAPDLQKLLNLAQSGPLHLVIDGAALVGTPLRVYGNTTIEFDSPSCGLYAKQGLNGPVLRNANWVSSYNGGTPVYDGSTVVDKGITILGGTINGNRGDGTSGNCTGGDPRLSATSHDGIGANQYIAAVMFFGVKNFAMRGTRVINSPSYTTHFANIFGMRLDHCSFIDPLKDQYQPSHRNTDGLHLNGPIDNLTATGLTIEAGDDGIALNADDGNLDGSTAPGSGEAAFGSFGVVYKGPITRVTIDGVRSSGMSVLRILSGTSRIDAIRVKNVSGSCYFHAVIGNLFGAIPGTGNIGRVTLENWDVDQTTNADGFMVFGGTYDVLTLRNINRVQNASAGGWPVILGGSSTANYGIVDIDGLNVHETADRQAGPVIDASYASFGSMRVRGTWTRLGLGTSTQPFLAVGNPTGNPALGALLLDGVSVERCTNLLRHSGTTLPQVRAVGCSYRGAASGSANNAIVTTGTITNLAAAGNAGLTTSGTITNNTASNGANL